MRRSCAPHVYQIAEILSNRYRDFNHYNRKNPLDELLFILCSVKRSEAVYFRAFRSLKQVFPRFEDLAKASAKELVSKVSWGGLQNQKAASVKALMETIVDRFGKPSLSKLKNLNDEECEEFLSSLPGVGKKVARCVLLYSLDREVFPVDTHCWRIAGRLGWIKRSATNTKYGSSGTRDQLQEIIPRHLRFGLHVNFVSLGREICIARKPQCDACPIERHCVRNIL
jgi:endonuclease III